VFPFPDSQQVWPVCEKAHDTIDVLFGDGQLQDDASELILQKLNLDARFDSVLAAKCHRNHKSAFDVNFEQRSFMSTVYQMCANSWRYPLVVS
jgi:hypothetical protein